jgi:hypothetical protein
MFGTRSRSKGSGFSKVILRLPGGSTPRLHDPAAVPRPRAAALSPAGYLSCSWSEPPKLLPPPHDLCFRFAKLAEGSDEAIRRFVRSWGMLNLHARATEEHVDDWRRYARLADAILRLSAQRLTGDRAEESDWATICRWLEIKNVKHVPRELELPLLAAAVNLWYTRAQGHSVLDLDQERLVIRPQACTLFGVLITQIAHVIAGTDQHAVCSGCKRNFAPKRGQSRGVRRYCKKCRQRKIPQRDAAREWRRRQRNNGDSSLKTV